MEYTHNWSHDEDLAEFPVGARVTIAEAEGKWAKHGFEATGRIVFRHGTVTRSVTPEDYEAVIVKLDDGDSMRISVAVLRRSKKEVSREENQIFQ